MDESNLENVEEVSVLAKKSRYGRFLDTINEVGISGKEATDAVKIFRKLNNATKNKRDKALFLDLMHAFGTFV